MYVEFNHGGEFDNRICRQNGGRGLDVRVPWTGFGRVPFLRSRGMERRNLQTDAQLFNRPGQLNPSFTVTLPPTLNGPARTVTQNLGPNGYFSMPLATFTSSFSYIDYAK